MFSKKLLLSFLVFNLLPTTLLAGWPGECSVILDNSLNLVTQDAVSSSWLWANGQPTVKDGIFSISPNIIINAGVHYRWVNQDITWLSFYFENGSWHIYHRMRIRGLAWAEDPPELASFHVSYHGNSYDALPVNCPVDCSQERAAFAVQCGGEDKIINWNEQTCIGDCINPCKENRDKLFRIAAVRKTSFLFKKAVLDGVAP